MRQEPESLIAALRSWLAGKLFLLAGWLDESYAVFLDGAPRRSEVGPDDLIWPGGDEVLSRENAMHPDFGKATAGMRTTRSFQHLPARPPGSRVPKPK